MYEGGVDWKCGDQVCTREVLIGIGTSGIYKGGVDWKFGDQVCKREVLIGSVEIRYVQERC